VNIASRIETLANGGEIYFSEAVYLVMNKSEVPIVEVGLRELKGIPEPVKIYRVPKDNENGGYHLTGSGQTPPAGLISNPLPTPTLPYGGFALERVKDRLPKPETEGSRSQYFSPAFTRLHFQAFVRKDRWSRAGGIRRLLAHPVYAFHWLGGALAILFNSRTLASPGLFWAGIKDRFKKRLGFRLAVLALIVAIGLAVVGWLTWRDYEMKLAAEREAAAQRVAAAEQEAATLRQQVAEREAAARNTRARQKPVEKKRKPGFHWFWDK
jgi:hypothetical protein